MNRAQLKVLTRLLDEAASQFSNHGCNDFNLAKQGLTLEELTSFKEGFVGFMKADDSMYEPSSGNYIEDWLAMRYLIKIAKDELSSGQIPL